MNQYLLLRDNKQSGPYSQEELISKGLKPYDLVWLDGKSAAWRYPSEIPELKAFAPAVEEQPYDRFYKKKPAYQSAASSTTSNTQQEPVSTEAVVATTPVATTNHISRPVTAKKIYVTLPAGTANRAATTTPVGKTELVNSPITDKGETSTSLLNEKFARLREEKIKQAENVATHPVMVNKPIDDSTTPPVVASSVIVEKNDSYQEAQPVPVQIPARHNSRLLMRSMAAACLLLGGVIIGLVISNNRQQRNNAALEQLVKQIQEREAKRQPASQADPVPVQDHLPAGDAIATVAADGQAPAGTVVDKTQEPSPKESPSPKNEQQATVKIIPAVVTNKPEEKRVNREELEQARKHIHQLVAVDANKYKVGVLGGISDLQLTVSNNSLYPLDQVEIEVRYLGPEKRVVKTQTLLLNDVGPGEQKTVEAPRTNRGVTVDYLITRINSKVLGLAHVEN